MHQYSVDVSWEDTEEKFSTGKYSRAHRWKFDGGVTVEASSSPNVVRLPYSREDAVDPEEAYVASLSSCHMLTFLFIAYQEHFVVKRYKDHAEGFMEKNAQNQEWISRVDLRPVLEFTGAVPGAEKLREMHEKAHSGCYIANSVKTEIVVHPQPITD
jgi:organic hydroperoxide reductase OsmC/OhrA